MSETTDERWLPIRRYEKLYEVSDHGRVRSLNREVVTRNQWGPLIRRVPGRVLVTRQNLRQELCVSLSREGEVADCRVHRLVLDAFAEPCPPGMEALHGRAGRLDNSLANLHWGTKAENQADRALDGTSNHGERNSQSRLTERSVAEIRHRYSVGENQRSLAVCFGVGKMTISDVVRGKTWQQTGSEAA